LADQASNNWTSTTTVHYSKGETELPIKQNIVGENREIEIDVQLNPMFKHDLSVTSIIPARWWRKGG